MAKGHQSNCCCCRCLHFQQFQYAREQISDKPPKRPHLKDQRHGRQSQVPGGPPLLKDQRHGRRRLTQMPGSGQ